MLVSFLMTDSVLQCDTHLYILNQKMQLSLLILNMTSSTRIRSSPTQKTCHNCGDFAHLIKDCKEKRRPPPCRPPSQPIRSNTFQQRSWDFHPNPKSYASITKGNPPLRSSVDDSMHNPHNLSTAPLHHFKKDILDTFKIITNEITNINNSFIDMKKEFSALKLNLPFKIPIIACQVFMLLFLCWPKISVPLHLNNANYNSHHILLPQTLPTFPLLHPILLMMMLICLLMRNHLFLINPLRYPPIYSFLNPHD